MRAFVTGATGFIGRHLVRALVDRGQQVTCLVRATSNRAGLEALGVDFHVGDVGDAQTLLPAGEADVVYHLAALLRTPWAPDFHSANRAGGACIAEACALGETPPTLVVVSSLAAGGPSDPSAPRRAEDPPLPVSLYGKAKLACEDAAVEHCARVPMSIVRPPMVFGEGDHQVLRLFRGVAKGWHAVPTRKTNHVAGIHAIDLAHALIAVAERGERVPDAVGWRAGQGVYYVADDLQPTYADFGRMVAKAIGQDRLRVLRLPKQATWMAAAFSELGARIRNQPNIFNLDKYREGTAGSWVCDTTKIKALGWAPERSFAERLEQTGAFYQAEGLI